MFSSSSSFGGSYVLIFFWGRESVFGYITVLPGAFSAYRYIALQNDVKGEGPLQKYFLGEKMVSLSFSHFSFISLSHVYTDVYVCM